MSIIHDIVKQTFALNQKVKLLDLTEFVNKDKAEDWSMLSHERLLWMKQIVLLFFLGMLLWKRKQHKMYRLKGPTFLCSSPSTWWLHKWFPTSVRQNGPFAQHWREGELSRRRQNEERSAGHL